MRNAGGAQETGGDQLVVRGEERRRAVEDADALRLELADDPQSVLDAVELRRHVETIERDVAPAEREERIPRSEQLPVGATPPPCGERNVRLGQLVCDDRELHAVSVREVLPEVGGEAVSGR
jgi:hypothetical protein